MRQPRAVNRAAQFMFASPRSAKHVRTPSCAKAFARMSYTRGLASVFIVPFSLPYRDSFDLQRPLDTRTAAQAFRVGSVRRKPGSHVEAGAHTPSIEHQ